MKFLRLIQFQTQVSYSDLWKIAYPIILGSLAQNVINITDTAFLGRVGTDELGASAIASTFYFLFVTIGMGFSIGSQIIISRRQGEGREDRIGKVVVQSFLFLAFVGLLVFIFFHTGVEAILDFSIDSDRIRDLAKEYIVFRSFGIVFVFMMLALQSFFTGIGKTRVTLYASLAGTLVNVILDYGLIFGNLGFPRMGLSGAALASGIAEVGTFLFVLIYFFRNVQFQTYRLVPSLKLDREVLRQSLKISLPIMTQHLISLGGWTTFFIMVEKMGAVNLAITNIIRSLYIVFLIPVWGFSTAVNTRVSFLIGAGRQEEVMGLIKKTAFLCLSTMLVLLGVLHFFPTFLLRIYTNDTVLISGAEASLQVVFLAALFLAVAVVYFNGVTGTGNTKTSLVIESTVIFMYLGYVYVCANILQGPISLVWTSEIFYSVVLFFFSIAYLSKGNWKKVRI